MFKRLLVSTIALSFAICALKGQTLDSTLFDNSFEKKVFNNYADSIKVNSLDVLISIDYSDKSDRIDFQIKNFCQELEGDGIRNNSKKKQIKEIYKKVHSTFLKKYQEDTYFSDIFYSGYYNCVTASALYSLILDYFNIDYTVKETPIHVYLVVDPKGEQIAIETTMPSNGLIFYDEKFKRNYVEYLKNNKLISDTEANTKSLDKLFEENYTSAKTINSTQLAALQYYNKGVTFFVNENYEQAARCFTKAEIIYPVKNVKFMKSNSLLLVLIEQLSSKKYNGRYLSDYLNTNLKNSISKEYVQDYVSTVSSELVINKPNIKLYKKFFNDFIFTVSDSVSTDEFYQTYNDFLGYYYYTNLDYPNALICLGESFKSNPDNIRNKQMINDITLKLLQDEYSLENNLDSFEVYLTKFAFLRSNPTVLNNIFLLYARVIHRNYEYGNTLIGKTYLDRAETFLKNYNNNIIDNGLISSIYAFISSYYYRNYNYDLAENYLKRGLEIVPNSFELQNQLKTLSSSKADLIKYSKSANYKARSTESRFLTEESLKVIRSTANNNREAINNNLDKYLHKTWKIESIVIDTKIQSFPKNEQLSLLFLKDGVVNIDHERDQEKGSWLLNKQNSTITINSGKTEISFSLQIFEIEKQQMKAIMSLNGAKEKMLVILKSYE